MRSSTAFALAFWSAFGLVIGGDDAFTVIRLASQAKCALNIGTCAADLSAPVRWRWPV